MEKANTAAEMRNLQSLSVLFTSMGALAHEMQKERGMTGGFLGSNGQKLKAELQAQRHETDKRLSELGQVVTTVDKRHLGEGSDQVLSSALDNLKGIADKRA